jgi:flagellar motor switch protein FliN/FliY
MSDGSLSQDEIDALLQETESLEIDMGPAVGAGEPLTDQEKSSFLSLLEGIAQTQASNLSILTRKSVSLEKPTLEIKAGSAILPDLPEEVVDVKLNFTDGLTGEHSYLLDVGAAQTIAGLMMGQAGIELDDAALSAVAEALSQISGSATTDIGNQVARTIKTTPADYQKAARDQARFPQGDVVIKLSYPLLIEGEQPGTLIELFSLSLVKEIVSLTSAVASATAAAPAAGAPAAAMAALGAGKNPSQEAGVQQTFGQPLSMQSPGFAQAPPNVQPVQFANLQAGAASSEQGNIGLLMDVFMEMTVELGRTKKLIREILGIGEGTIIELDKLAGEPVDILVNHKLIAKGEVVVIDENFGVRVTEIVSPMERMSDLT